VSILYSRLHLRPLVQMLAKTVVCQAVTGDDRECPKLTPVRTSAAQALAGRFVCRWAFGARGRPWHGRKAPLAWRRIRGIRSYNCIGYLRAATRQPEYVHHPAPPRHVPRAAAYCGRGNSWCFAGISRTRSSLGARPFLAQYRHWHDLSRTHVAGRPAASSAGADDGGRRICLSSLLVVYFRHY